MRIEFSYTFDDLKELMVPEIYAADARKHRRRRILNLASWAVICATIGGSIWVANLIHQGATTGNQPQDLVVELLPSALPAAFACTAMSLGAWESWRKSRARQDLAQPVLRQGKVTRLITSVLFGTIIGGFIFTLITDFSLIWHPTRTQMVLVGAAPWMAVFALIIALSAPQRRWKARQQWLNRPAWRRPHVLELDEHGYCLADPMTRVDLAWRCFARVRETKNLLVLVGEDGTSHPIPKRAFADPGDVARCRALLQNMIPNSKFLVAPSGFAVLPKPVLAVPQDQSGAASA